MASNKAAVANVSIGRWRKGVAARRCPAATAQKMGRGDIEFSIAFRNDIISPPLSVWSESWCNTYVRIPIFASPCPCGVGTRRKNYIRIPSPRTARITAKKYPPCRILSAPLSLAFKVDWALGSMLYEINALPWSYVGPDPPPAVACPDASKASQQLGFYPQSTGAVAPAYVQCVSAGRCL